MNLPKNTMVNEIKKYARILIKKSNSLESEENSNEN